MNGTERRSPRQELDAKRESALRKVERMLDGPMVVLGFAWLLLLVLELVRGIGPVLQAVVNAIWITFILDFLLRLSLAPAKGAFLRRNVLTGLSLALPALRVFRVARVLRVARTARAIRGLRLVRLFTSLNRGLRALRATMARRGLAYVLALTLVVTVAGAAGMYAFEPVGPDGRGFATFGDALWWTAMILVTLGSDFWPSSGEGRILCFVLAVYAFTVFGYVTAAIASYFVGRDADDARAEVAGAGQLRALESEIRALRRDLERWEGARAPGAGRPAGEDAPGGR